MKRRWCSPNTVAGAAALLGILAAVGAWGQTATERAAAAKIGSGSTGWSVSGGPDGLDFRWGDRLVTTYRTEDGPKPYFYPLIGPTGEGVTRGYPMDPQPDESPDHPHHRSLWFGHRNVNGVDFWSEAGHGEGGKKRGIRGGTIRHAAVSGIQISGRAVTVRVRNEWIDDQGAKLCEDVRAYRLEWLGEGEWAMDWDITVRATETDCVFGDNKDGTMAIRVIPGLRLQAGPKRQEPGTGHILTSEGWKDEEAWGKRARWVDYHGLDRQGRPVGVAMFDHPENLRHPTWWHARNYGLFAANPFGVHDFEKKPPHTGDHTVPRGESLRLRYRILVHEGPGETEALEAAWRLWAAGES